MGEYGISTIEDKNNTYDVNSILVYKGLMLSTAPTMDIMGQKYLIRIGEYKLYMSNPTKAKRLFAFINHVLTTGDEAEAAIEQFLMTDGDKTESTIDHVFFEK